LEAVEGIGPIVADSIVNFFKQKRNQHMIQQILDSGVKLGAGPRKRTDRLKDKVFVLTGTLESMKRSQAKELINAAGGKVSASVSGNTDYLVTGESPGSKLTKAEELGIAVIDEAAFKELFE
jgi:DNA ligase (NAD+)